MLYEETARGLNMTGPSILTFAYVLDLLIGDPRQLPHPVRGIGIAIEKIEGMLRGIILKAEQKRGDQNDLYPPQSPLAKGGIKGGSYLYASREKRAGVALTIIIVGLTYALFYVINKLLLNPDLSTIGRYLAFVILVYLVSTTLATRELVQSGESVTGDVMSGNISKARIKLSMIVGRDTESLDNKGILKATIETLAENASDGIVAPLFYFALGGLPLAMAYKAINTLDSMVGYKNEKYKNFGWASARLDDIANYVPARITGLLIVSAAFIFDVVRNIRNPETFCSSSSNSSRGSNCLNAFKVMFRDGNKHASPNSGFPEAAMAGALGVQLGGSSIYNGVMIEKPFMGKDIENREDSYLESSKTALTITRITSFIGLIIALAILYMRSALWN